MDSTLLLGVLASSDRRPDLGGSARLSVRKKGGSPVVLFLEGCPCKVSFYYGGTDAVADGDDGPYENVVAVNSA